MNALQPAEFAPYTDMQLWRVDEGQEIQFNRVMFENIDVGRHYFVSVRDPEFETKDYFARVTAKDVNNPVVRFEPIVEREAGDNNGRGTPFDEPLWPGEQIASRAWVNAAHDAPVKYFFWVRRAAAGGSRTRRNRRRARRTLRRRR